jgi:hypothetical protein
MRNGKATSSLPAQLKPEYALELSLARVPFRLRRAAGLFRVPSRYRRQKAAKRRQPVRDSLERGVGRGPIRDHTARLSGGTSHGTSHR